MFFSGRPRGAQRRSSPPAGSASSAHPNRDPRRRWGPKRNFFRPNPGVPRRGGRRPRNSAKCKNRFPLRQWGAGGRPGPHWAQIAPLMPCRASAGQDAPGGAANGLRPGGGCSFRLREFSLLRPGARSFGGRSPVAAQCGVADLVGGGGREGGVHGRARLRGNWEKMKKMLPPAPRSGIGPCPPHPGAQSRSLAVRKPKNLLPNGKPASAVPRGAPRSPIPRPRPFRAFARRGGANSCAARAPAVALGKARRSPGVVG